MSDLGDTLVDLLNGDLVRLETADLAVETEVVGHDRERHEDPASRRAWGYALRFMPVGDDAVAVPADRYRVTVEPDGCGGWAVGELFAEIYVEEKLRYATEPRGDLVSVEVLGRP